MVVPAFTATLSPALRSVSSFVANFAAGALLEETLSIMRTRSVVPAGRVTLAGAGWERPVGEGTGAAPAVGGAAVGGVAAGGVAAGGVAAGGDAPPPEVEVCTTICDVSTDCSPASFL